MHILETGGPVKEKGLIALAKELGIANLLIDPGVVPLGSGAGTALSFSMRSKPAGIPVGSGIHNAVSPGPGSALETGNQEMLRCGG